MVAIAEKGNADAKARGLIEKALPAAYKAGFGETASHVTLQLANDTEERVRRAVAQYALPAACEAGFGGTASRVAARLADDTDIGVRRDVAGYALPAACEAGFGEAASRAAARLTNDTDELVRRNVAEYALPAASKTGFGEAAWHAAARLATDKDAGVRGAVAGSALPAACASGFGEAASHVAARLADDTDAAVRCDVAGYALPAACEAGFGEAASRAAARLTNDTYEGVRRGIAHLAVPAIFKAGFSEAAWHAAARLGADKDAGVRMFVAEYALPAACEAGFGEAASGMAARLAADKDEVVRARVAEYALPAACRAGFGEAASRVATQLAADKDGRVRLPIAEYALPAACEAGFGEAASRAAARLAADKSGPVRERVAEYATPAVIKAGFASVPSQIMVRALKDSSLRVVAAAARGMENATAQLPGLGINGLRVLAAASDAHSHLARRTSQALAQELITNLSEQAGKTVEIHDDMLCAHPGAMLLLNPRAPFGIRAHHCPNAQACNTTRCLPLERADGPASLAMCREGYQSGSEGCSRCEAGHGRSLRDPFQCEACSNDRWRQLLPHVASPVAIYAMALRSSWSEKSQFGSVLKITVAFGTTASVTLRALLLADDVAELFRSLKGMLDPAILSLEVASGAGGSSSLDCLLAQGEKPADPAALRAAMAAVPFALLGLTAAALLVNALWRCHSLWDLTTSFLHIFVVWTAVFLPALLMASLLTVPCVSTQAVESRRQWLAWDMDTECGSQSYHVPALMVTAVLAAGPATWVWLMCRSQAFPEDMLNFLVAGYKPGNHWWEVVVLTRRSMDTVIIVLMPLSYAAFSQSLATAGLMASAVAVHAYVQPYNDPMLNMLEFLNLLSNTLAVILTSYVTGSSWSQTPGLKVAAFVAVVVLLLGTGAALAAALLVSAARRRAGR